MFELNIVYEKVLHLLTQDMNLLDCDTEPAGFEGENDGPLWIISYNCAALYFNCAA